MNYKLYKEPQENLTAKEQILYNRGIPVEEQEAWLNAGWESINDWRAFGEKEMRQAVLQLNEYIQKNKKIAVLVDCDPDGYTSAAIIINFFWKHYPNVKIDYILHTGKQHGLADIDLKNIIENYDMLWVPDAGSNDYEQHKILKENNIWILITDHHECNEYSNWATTINNQMCGYPNKALSGVGVTWQFLRAYEEIFELPKYTENLIDLVAFGNISDMMNYRSIETRAIVNLGLQNIKNPFLRAMAKTNEYSIQKMNGLNYYSVAFYITPYLNACIRTGTSLDKEIVFKSLCMPYAFEETENTKRGHKGEKIPLYEEAITVVQRIKRLQTKLQDDSMSIIEKHIKNENLLDNAVLAVICEPGEVEKNIAGLCANKIQAKYQRPSMVLIKTKNKDDNEIVYRGSARNYSLCEIQNFKDICETTGEMELAQGHQGAWGSWIKSSHFDNFIQKTNEFYKDIDLSANYWVDYIWNQNNIDSQKVLDIADLNIYGQEIPESLVAVQNIPLNENNVTLMGLDKGHPTLKVQCGSISIIKFKSSEEEYEEWIQPNSILTVVGKCAKNEWMGRISGQILVEDYDLQQKWVF